jgi:hypothetical protein
MLARNDEAEKKEKAQREHDREQKRITKKRSEAKGVELSQASAGESSVG